MNLKQIIKKVIAGEMPDAGEIEFLKNNSFEENRFLVEIDRLEEVNAALTREVESVRDVAGQTQVKQSESELGSLRQLTKQLSEERDNAQKELKHWKYRQQIGELATQYHFSDVEYLAYLCEKNQIDLSTRDAAEGFMTDLRSKTPKFFRSDVQPGAKADQLAVSPAVSGTSITDMLSAAPEITR